jgi:mannose-6-phosphate isomerase class I
LVRAASIDIN